METREKYVTIIQLELYTHFYYVFSHPRSLSREINGEQERRKGSERESVKRKYITQQQWYYLRPQPQPHQSAIHPSRQPARVSQSQMNKEEKIHRSGMMKK